MTKIVLVLSAVALILLAIGSPLRHAQANGAGILSGSTGPMVIGNTMNDPWNNSATSRADDPHHYAPRAATHRSRGGSGLGVDGSSSSVFQATDSMNTRTRGTQPQAAGLIIVPVFDSSIANDPNSAAIEATINQAISIFESEISTPINVSILFRYAPAEPNGNPFGDEDVSTSNYTTYSIPWNTFITPLRTSAASQNDAVAIASLPATPMSTNIVCSSANGRAVGLSTPAGLLSNGEFQTGAPYDGIVNLNSTAPFQFGRTDGGVASNVYDAQRFIEHEMDEVLGFGSYLNLGGSDVRPQDLFSWASAGTRNVSGSGTRYFSIDGGVTQIVGFNQQPDLDFGDWLSSCPAEVWHVQDALGCEGQVADIATNSPEGVNLDVIGYNAVPEDFSLSLNTPKVSTKPGKKVTVSVEIDRSSSFSGSVTVTPPSLVPAGLKVAGAAQSTTGGSVSFKVSVKTGAKAGTYILTFSGSDTSGQTETAELTLVVK